MWTQRDQIHAYQFLRRRLISALVSADANHPVSPSRRLIMGTALSVAVTVLVVGGFGIAGVLHPAAHPDWRRGGQVIVEKETAARFVLGQDGMMHPVINYASARLLAGGDGARTVTVAANKLAAAPRGAALGIVDAPDSLPLATRLLPGPWTACSQVPAAQPASTAPVSTLILGPHSPGAIIGAGKGVLVRIPSGERFVLSDGQRFRIRNGLAAAALGYDGVPTLAVSPAFVNAVPVGRDLLAIAVDPDQVGTTGPTVGSTATRVGQVLQVGGVDSSRYYLVRADGIARITQTEASLVLGDPANRAANPSGPPQPHPVTPYGIATAPHSVRQPALGYPDRVPQLVPIPPRGSAVCTEGDGLHGSHLFLSSGVPLAPGADVTPTRGSSDPRTADQVYVPPTTGALVAATQSTGAPAGTTYLVTDTGRRYPVVDAAAVSALGYGSSSHTGVAGSVLALLPSGVPLDPAAAQQVVGGAGR